MAGDPRIRLLLALVEQAYRAPSWHGTPLGGALRGLTHRQALWRPGGGRGRRHCIWEIVLHTAYWKYVVRRRLLRDEALAFARGPSNWPALPERTDQGAWRADRAILEREHALLVRTIARFDPGKLGRRGWRSRWTNVEHIYGVASHDLYHAGQIQLLKRLMRPG
ncbi:MAG TPA: DinB family protein [Gemmatimonadales bacterium]|nr:DinB family protein [Gemmatimonadales bacterium]